MIAYVRQLQDGRIEFLIPIIDEGMHGRKLFYLQPGQSAWDISYEALLPYAKTGRVELDEKGALSPVVEG